MDAYYGGYYGYVRKSLSHVGLWPYDDPNFRKIRKSFFGFILLMSLSLQISGFLLLPFSMKALYKFSVRISPTLFCNLTYFWLMLNDKALKKLLDWIRAEFRMRSTEERKVVQSYVDNARNYLFGLIYGYSIIFIITIGSEILLLVKRITPLNEIRISKYPLSMGYYEKFQSYYFVILIVSYVIILTEMIIGITVWNTYIHFVHHICAMFRVAGNMLEHVLNEKNETRNALVRVIDYHNDCLRLLNEINVMCERTLLFEVFLAMIVLCMDVLYLADIKDLMGDYNELLLYTMHICCQIFLLCCSCHFGQIVLDHGVQFYTKAYTFPWYTTPLRIQRMCLFMMTKSVKPLYLSIGKIFVLSYELLLTVLNTSISYAIVFRSL